MYAWVIPGLGPIKLLLQNTVFLLLPTTDIHQRRNLRDTLMKSKAPPPCLEKKVVLLHRSENDVYSESAVG